MSLYLVALYKSSVNMGDIMDVDSTNNALKRKADDAISVLEQPKKQVRRTSRNPYIIG